MEYSCSPYVGLLPVLLPYRHGYIDATLGTGMNVNNAAILNMLGRSHRERSLIGKDGLLPVLHGGESTIL